MSADKPFSRTFLLGVFGLIFLAGVASLIFRDTATRDQPNSPSRSAGPGEVHFAPDEDLEGYDLRLLGTAKDHVDIAMYSFTDQKLADELLFLAGRGVEIHLYRDGLQFSDEQARAEKRSALSTTNRLIGKKHIEIKINELSASMHLKAFCIDGDVLRIGSANWSESGELRQDNDLIESRDPRVVRSFETDFEELWNRPSNRVE